MITEVRADEVSVLLAQIYSIILNLDSESQQDHSIIAAEKNHLGERTEAKNEQPG